MKTTQYPGFQLDDKLLASSSNALPLGEWYALQSAGAAFHALADTMPQLVWSTLPDGSHDYYNARWYEFTGAPVGSTDGEGWAGMFHEEDQPNAWANWNHSLQTGEPYEVQYRLRHKSGNYRWMIGRALPIRDAEGTIVRWIGTCTDIEDEKRITLQNELLNQELSHRIKNIFAVVSGLISLSSRAKGEITETARELLSRIGALGRAHEYVRPQIGRSDGSPAPMTLHKLLDTIFDAYPAYGLGRLTVSGPDIVLDSRAATPMALIMHELATNAMKYGALARAEGRIAVEFHEEGDTIVLRWSESGGPPSPTEEPRTGFGSRLIDMAARQQLGGTFERFWNAEGLELKMQFPRARLTAPKT